jgi:DNA primase
LRYDQNFIEKVRDANNIVDIIAQYTELKSRGHQHMGLCPFPDHNEKTGSFSVSENKQLYHCFGCKKSGNVFTFLEVYNGFSFVESLEYLANRAHIPMPEPEENKNSKRPVVSKSQKQNYHRANKFAAVFYHQKLKSLSKDHKLQNYLKKRKLTQELIDEFRIGYAPETWDELTKYYQEKKVPDSVASDLGLIRKNKMGGYFDMFRDRLMFPIFSIDSSVIGFGGRIIDQGQPKYINSVESEVFKKGQSFYGLEKSATHIRSADQVFVVEGYMDFLALYGQGVKNVVATLGTALTERHVKVLKRWTKNIILLFDGDAAGQSAANRSLHHFFEQDLSPQIFILPDGKDPDDYIHEVGATQFFEKAKTAEDLFFHMMRIWMKDYKGNPKDKIEIVDQAAPLLLALKDQRLLQLYTEHLANQLGEGAAKIYGWIKGSHKAIMPRSADLSALPEDLNVKLSLEGVPQDELVLLGLSLKSLKYLNFFVNHQGLEYVSHDTLKKLFAQVVAKHGQEPENFDKLANLVVSRVKDPEKIINLINISSEDEVSEREETLLKECFIRVKDRFLQRKATVLVNQMKNDPNEEKLERFVNIQNDRKALKELKNTPLGE